MKKSLLPGLMLAASLFGVVPAGAAPSSATTSGTLIPVQQFTLPNGLRVVFHIDRSDPVVAVALAAHVGSGREEPGRTGFAHMFEHLFFLDSENLGPGGLDKLTARVGGSGANGFTNRDQTIYLQTVPSDALEKMIWAEADKLGYFIGTVTDPVLAKEKQVVKNEKRQAVDNLPYGHAPGVFFETMYPKGHPYSWSTIGSLADLDAATLADVKRFHARYYVPNNTTLVLAGDFDPVQARRWVEKYFGDIPRGATVPRPGPRPAALAASKSLFHEDGFAQLPQFSVGWPTVPAMHPDLLPLMVLQKLLADAPDGPLHRRLVDDLKLTDRIESITNDSQVAGEAVFVVRAFDGVDLDRVQAGMTEGFARFEADGVDPAALDRAKTQLEVQFYRLISSVVEKSARLARFDGFLGDPTFADTELARLRAITPADITRVYRTYLKGRPSVTTSFVPKSKPELAVAGATRATVVEEAIVQGAEAAIDPSAGRPSVRSRTASSFDRSVEPPAGPKPVLKIPAIWTGRLANGLAVSGIEDRELPVVRFQLAIDGGRLRDDPKRPGAANLVARMLPRGTAKWTRAEFEMALKQLGAELEVSAEDERLIVSGSTLARTFPDTMKLVEEMILEPRWDAAELDLVKAATIAAIQADRAEPDALAERVFARAAYGADHVLAQGPRGTEAAVRAFTPADLARFHASFLSPDAARVRFAGAVDEATALRSLARLGTEWTPRALPPLPSARFAAPDRARLYFYDVPGAKQSTLLFGQPGPNRADPAFYPATSANFILGGGGFASRLTQQVREAKGYTYGVRSRFEGGTGSGRFSVTSPVRSNVTLEAATLIRDIVRDYGTTVTDADVELTRQSLAKSRARSFETLDAKLGMLAAIGDHGLPADYVLREAALLERLTLAEVQALTRARIDPSRMIYVVVGDAATQAARLSALGYGEPVMMTLEDTAPPE